MTNSLENCCVALGCKGYREIKGMVPEFKLLWCIWRDTWRIEEREVNDEEGEAKSGTEIQRRSYHVGQRIWREHAGGVRPSAGLRWWGWEWGHGREVTASLARAWKASEGQLGRSETTHIVYLEMTD